MEDGNRLKDCESREGWKEQGGREGGREGDRYRSLGSPWCTRWRDSRLRVDTSQANYIVDGLAQAPVLTKS